MEIEKKILKWSEDKGILTHSHGAAQTLKAMSEMGELADAIVAGRRELVADAIGDIAVCLVNVAFFYATSLEECMELAYEQIKHRKGRMVAGGAFVKDGLS